jgi:PKD repeat protein
MKFISTFLFILIVSYCSSQELLHCATDKVMSDFYKAHPDKKFQKQQSDEMQRQSYSNLRKRSGINVLGNASYTIPIVFHILHMDGPENISDNQVRDALRILNRDFAHQNPDTTEIIQEFKPIADSAGIEFVLATKDPFGNCTNGIMHYYDGDTDWNDFSPTIYSHTWDPTRYLNVYVVRSITMSSGFGAAGYTYFPGTFSPGDNHDAIVVLNNYFASIGTGDNFLSRVLTHEVGHWLDLYHVFGSTNGAGVDCFNDDFVNDTPPTAGYLVCPDPSNPATYQLCNTGVSENFQNYMDYSYCCRMFTQGQILRMHNCLQTPVSGRDNLWSQINLLTTGVTSPNTMCIPVADFRCDRREVCSGKQVTFHDASSNGYPSSYNWTFAGGNPSSSTDSTPTVTYTLPGIYSVTYSCSNAAGFSSPVTKFNYITVISNTATYSSTWTEGFETSPLPNSDWKISNSSGGADWQQISLVSFTGQYSAAILSTGNTRKAKTEMTSPIINLSGIANPFLNFQLAAADSIPQHVNMLQVFATDDCEETWTEIYSKVGQNLLTSASTADPFVPAINEWRKEYIDLFQFATSTTVRFKFVYTRDTIPMATNIFIDDINISDITGIAEHTPPPSLDIFPNPSNGIFDISVNTYSGDRLKISVTDLLGRRVKTISDAMTAAGRHQFNIQNEFQKGIYFVNLENTSGRISKKLIIH